MNLILTFDQLKDYKLQDCKQFWYYVILVNPCDLTPAGQAVFDNLNIFHLDSGEECQYFVPGFINTGKNLFKKIESFFSSRKTVDIPNFGKLQFDDADFVNFYLELEKRNCTNWRYSGECELLLFNISMGDKIKLNNFISYNLDDIVRNRRNVSEFIRATINIGKDATDQTKAKQLLDEKFYDMIMPEAGSMDEERFKKGWEVLNRSGFRDDSYLFISYSSKDYRLVSSIRDNLKSVNIPCWMAPFDIPSGYNYALVIEHAIKHANKFVLMLSQSAVDSVWVGKELKRAISRFQSEAPEKICVVWLNGQFRLEDTPFALPLEDIQIEIDLANNPNNYYLLASKEKHTEILNAKKSGDYLEEIQQFLSPDNLVTDMRHAISRIYAIQNIWHDTSEIGQRLSVLTKQMNAEVEIMEKQGTICSQEFTEHYLQAVKLFEEALSLTQKLW